MTFWLVRTEGQPCASSTKNLTKQGELTLSYTRNKETLHEAPLYAFLFAFSYKMGGRPQILQILIMKGHQTVSN